MYILWHKKQNNKNILNYSLLYGIMYFVILSKIEFTFKSRQKVSIFQFSQSSQTGLLKKRVILFQYLPKRM